MDLMLLLLRAQLLLLLPMLLGRYLLLRLRKRGMLVRWLSFAGVIFSWRRRRRTAAAAASGFTTVRLTEVGEVLV